MKPALSRLFAIFIAVHCCSQAVAIGHQDFTFQLSPASSELTQQTVRDIFEDSRGFIWVLTQEGLNRFDGYEVIKFRATNAAEGGLSHQSITGMVEDSDGHFWITTAGGGLNKLNANDFSFESYRYTGENADSSPLSNVIMSAMISETGSIWLGYGQGAGYSIFDPVTGSFSHYPDTDPESVGIVRDFAQTANGLIWMAIEDKGLYVVNPAQPGKSEKVEIKSISRPSLDVVKLTDLMTDTRGNLWVTSLSDGLIGVNPRSKAVQYLSHELASPSAGALESYVAKEDGNGNIWVGTTNGIHVVSADKRRLTNINTTNSGLPDDQIFSLSVSKSGLVWVGTYNGLAYGTRSFFERYSQQDGLSSSSTNAFAQTTDGLLWIANDAGIDVINTVSDETSTAPISISSAPFDLPANRVMSLLADGNSLWAGTLSSGLFFINRDDKQITHYERDTSNPNGLNANGITSLLKLDQNTVLIGTYGGGLNELKLDTQEFISHTFDPTNPTTISSDMVVALYMDSIGDIWVGTERGLNRFNSKTKEFTAFETNLENPTAISSNMAWAMGEDSEGSLWIGTQSGGINRWAIEHRLADQGIFQQYSSNIGIPSDDIYSVTPHEDHIWLSHNRGITKLGIQDLSAINFNITDGLQGPEFNHGAAFKDNDGFIYFGGPNGFNRISPDGAERSDFNPPVQLTAIKILNQDIFFDIAYDQLMEVTLDYNFDFITFSFAALDYSNPLLNQYRYRLNGLNESWIDLGSNRQVSFTRLPPGDYTLTVEGTNSDGVWSENRRTLQLIVTPPFWMTWWAYLIYSIILALLLLYVAALQNRRNRRQERRRRELEEKVRERTRDLQEARIAAENATKAKSEFLAAMSHEIRTPMHGMLGMTDLLMQTALTDQQKQFAQSAKSSGESLLKLVNAILDFSKIEAKKVELELIEFNLRKLIEETCYLQHESAARKGIDFNLRVSSSIKHLHKGDPSKIGQVITNLLGNAIKFTNRGSVFVDVSEQSIEGSAEQLVCVKISDTGIGIDKNVQERIFESFTQADTSTTRKYGGTGLGLTISRELVDLMRGEIHLESKVGSGTSFVLEIPLGIGKPISPPTIPQIGRVEICTTSEGTRKSLESIFDFVSAKHNIQTIESLKGKTQNDESLLILEYQDVADDVASLTTTVENARTIFVANSPTIEIHPINFPHRVVLKPITLNSIIAACNEIYAAEAPSQVGAQSKQLPEDLDSNAAPLQVLIVEDVEVNQQIASTMLSILGAQVTITGNGKEALEALQNQRFDIVFMDCQMPVMDGLQATREVRRTPSNDKFDQNIPIVALTAGGDNSERESALLAGMDYYITKPFSLDDVRRILNKVFENYDERYSQARSAEPDPPQSKIDALHDVYELDEQILEAILDIELRSGKPLLQQLLTGFRDQAQAKRDEILAAIDLRDTDSIRKGAHAIKSMSANIGAAQVRSTFDEMERNYNKTSFEKLREDTSAIDDQLERFYLALEVWLTQRTDKS